MEDVKSEKQTVSFVANHYHYLVGFHTELSVLLYHSQYIVIIFLP